MPWLPIAIAIAIVTPLLADEVEASPENFVFFNRDRDRISEATFLENEAIIGAQLKYTWRELEPERDRYELEELLADLEFLEAHGKRLFVQLQDVSFDERLNVPRYLVESPEFSGGAARKFEPDGDGGPGRRFDGWVARRWDPTVTSRFERLLSALGEAIDGRIEGVTLAETAISFGDDASLHPEGFSFESYATGMKDMMSAARKAFPRSRVIVYANFMPGEWLPWEDQGYLRGIYAHAERIGVGVGGPDLLPHRKGQRDHSYRLIAARGPDVAAGVAVQEGNLAERHPESGQPMTAAELYRFASEELRLDYIFWGAHEPRYTRQVLPFLHSLAEERPSR